MRAAACSFDRTDHGKSGFMSGAPVKIGLAGIGGFGDLYLEALLPRQRELNVELVGCVEPLPHRCRHIGELRARNIPIHTTLSALFADASNGGRTIDLMMIVTPIHL